MATPNRSEARPCRICGYPVIGDTKDEASFVHGFCTFPNRPATPAAPAATASITDVTAWDAWQRGVAEAKRILAEAEQEKKK